jgi:hypothetical protein
MSLEATVCGLLGPLVGGRCYVDDTSGAKLPQVFPLIIIQEVGGQAIDYLEGKVADKDNARLQVHVWAVTRAEAKQIARAARVALVEGATKATTLGNAVALRDQAANLRGTRQDFSIWYVP